METFTPAPKPTFAMIDLSPDRKRLRLTVMPNGMNRARVAEVRVAWWRPWAWRQLAAAMLLYRVSGVHVDHHVYEHRPARIAALGAMSAVLRDR